MIILILIGSPVFGTEITAPKPNVILITISSLRSDHVSCLGYPRNTTPNFDTFSESSTLFSSAYATSSWMMPAAGSIFTSLYPTEHHATDINRQISANAVTLGEILQKDGYFCAGFCCNPRLSSENGFARGFHYYDDYSVELIVNNLSSTSDDFDINTTRTNDLINDAAIRWLENNSHQPFFLFVHFYDNHWDYLPPAGYDTLYDRDYRGPLTGNAISKEPLYSNRPPDRDVDHLIALYDGQVRRTDEDLGDLMEYLKQKKLFDSSIIIICGDHGEQFYEHGHTSHHGIYDELLHVPLAVHLPTAKRVTVFDGLVSGIDIMPTILDYTSIDLPTNLRGVSLRKAIEEGTAVRDFVFAEYTGGAVEDSFALRTKVYKVIQTDKEMFYFDLASDPSELRMLNLENAGEDILNLAGKLQKLRDGFQSNR